MIMLTIIMIPMMMVTMTHDHDGGHDGTEKNLLNCHQRLPDVFGPPMEGNLVQGFLYQAEKCKIFLPNKILVTALILVIGAIVT